MANRTDSINISKNIAKNNIAFTHNLISTSYHEAGHTIYGLLHLAKIESVRVFPYGKNKVHGFTNFDFFTAEDMSDSKLINYAVISEICLMYAGLTAEKYHFKTISGSDKFPLFLKDGSSDDTKKAAKLIKQYEFARPGKQRYRFKKNLIAKTLEELKNNWEAVNCIAHGLFQKKQLFHDDLKNLLCGGKNKKFWREQFKSIDHIYDNFGSIDEKYMRLILDKHNLL